ncbi:hypothetical protein H0H92_007832, partial [Tricholoma furcatifolium]
MQAADSSGDKKTSWHGMNFTGAVSGGVFRSVENGNMNIYKSGSVHNDRIMKYDTKDSDDVRNERSTNPTSTIDSGNPLSSDAMGVDSPSPDVHTRTMAQLLSTRDNLDRGGGS